MLVVVGRVVVVVDVEVVGVEVVVDEAGTDVDELDVVDDDVVVVEEVDVLVEEVDVVDDDVVGTLASGPQFGSVSAAGTSLTSRVTPDPSGFIVNRSGPLGAPKSCEREEKTILLPSGDQAGSVPVLISLVWPPPSAFRPDRCPRPDRW
ncbi:MAG: hypothetical protein M3144_10090 [Actinomycetota bacterium]|nr:hypothetical protein [Actinomycetota bacterium]